ncbi:MAG: 2Fe-2S iron-sulfur cluster-binding protein, partial [Pseudomonadota bacterium]|nr:2Fe-2S iron-sulfur cluster-binding protein [Pseudomonadota bacterium]
MMNDPNGTGSRPHSPPQPSSVGGEYSAPAKSGVNVSTRPSGATAIQSPISDQAGVTFELDGTQVEALHGETIWQVAKRLGTDIPHLCHQPEPGYRPDGNCRACMVEIEGERVLAASCMRKPAIGMKVKSASERAYKAQKMVMELLVADQPARATSHDPT